MAKTGFIHHIGTLLLFVSAILLLITTISSPVINNISLLKVNLPSTVGSSSSVTFGTFGYCILGNDQDACSGKHIGYDPAGVMASIDGTGFGTVSSNTPKGLTRVMILHPICCGLAFIAFLLSLGSGIIGGLLASIVAALTWVLTLAVMATDFAAFGIIKNKVNDDEDGTGSNAVFGVAMWTILAAMVLLFFATFIVLFSCCSARRHKHDGKLGKHEAGYAHGTTTTHKRRFWQRRNRY